MRRRAIRAFDEVDEPIAGEIDAAVFGSLSALETGRVTARPLAIDSIRPDRGQPRRAMPSMVRAHWDGSPASVRELLQTWAALAEVERTGAVASVKAALARMEIERPEELGPVEAALLDVALLAGDIQANGLTNPITVVGRDNAYRIETGERRWLAYHLLVLATGEDRWLKIPAVVAASASVWRQASENNVRRDLNAIGRARQLAILLMDIYTEAGHHFTGFDEMVNGPCDRAYYAQVSDGDVWRVPRGESGRILAAMGLQHAVQIRQYRALLRLPDALWLRADDENWPEKRIREAVTGVTVDDGEDMITPVISDSSTPVQLPLPLFDELSAKLLKRISTYTTESVADERRRRDILREIAQARLLLDEVEKRVRG